MCPPPKHVYHVSPSTNRDAILKSGLVPRTPGYRSEHYDPATRKWMDQMKRPRGVYVCHNFKNALEYQNELKVPSDIYKIQINQSMEVIYDSWAGVQGRTISASIILETVECEHLTLVDCPEQEYAWINQQWDKQVALACKAA